MWFSSCVHQYGVRVFKTHLGVGIMTHGKYKSSSYTLIALLDGVLLYKYLQNRLIEQSSY
ncbi:hypothetical protein PDY_35590 [Photobacterium damselae subsp. damselae]|nr:hypothetical protein PDY_35590 [Photobacterium damselae subsp. damselae]